MMDIIDSMMNYNEGLLWYHMAIITLGIPHSQLSNVNWVITWGGGGGRGKMLPPPPFPPMTFTDTLPERGKGGVGLFDSRMAI